MSMPTPPPPAVPDAGALRKAMIANLAAASVGGAGNPGGVYQSALAAYLAKWELSLIQPGQPQL